MILTTSCPVSSFTLNSRLLLIGWTKLADALGSRFDLLAFVGRDEDNCRGRRVGGFGGGADGCSDVACLRC
jgi:hypothetical protein